MTNNKGWGNGELREVPKWQIEDDLKYWEFEKRRQEYINSRRRYQERKRKGIIK